MADALNHTELSESASEASHALGGDNEARLVRDDFDRNVHSVLGAPVDAVNIDQAISAIDAAIRNRSRLSFVTPNVNWLVRAIKDPAARREIINADLSLIDGAPVEAIAKRIGVPITSRVAGSDLFEALRRRPAFAGRRIKVFFFGGRDGAAETAAAKLNEERGGLQAVGWHNPGFGDVQSMSDQATIDKINEAAPDFVVVSLGAAKGQAWIEHNRDRLTAPVTAHLGAVVDFTAGGIARAPKIFRSTGLEWAWRIMAEPSLWRRYFDDGVALMRIALTRRAALRKPKKLIKAASPARARIENSTDGDFAHLAGDLISSDLAQVRSAFRIASTGRGDVTIDLSQAGEIDHGFLGLVLMLEKHVVDGKRRLLITGANARQLAFLSANAMTYTTPSGGDQARADAAAA